MGDMTIFRDIMLKIKW